MIFGDYEPRECLHFKKHGLPGLATGDRRPTFTTNYVDRDPWSA